LDIRDNISSRLRQVCSYADGISIVARTQHALADTFIKFNEEAQKAGVIINVNKTKYMKCSRNQVKEKKWIWVEFKLEMYHHLNVLDQW
jgi:NRPS condensation-like uncharacterized protein